MDITEAPPGGTKSQMGKIMENRFPQRGTKYQNGRNMSI